MLTFMSEYNGWTNYETWNVYLWLSNEEGSYTWARELVREAHQQPREEWVPDCISDHDRGRHRAAEALKDAVTELEEGRVTTASMASDLLGAAFSEVDWAEVADAFLEE